jgi:hypothetical protein
MAKQEGKRLKGKGEKEEIFSLYPPAPLPSMD